MYVIIIIQIFLFDFFTKLHCTEHYIENDFCLTKSFNEIVLNITGVQHNNLLSIENEQHEEDIHLPNILMVMLVKKPVPFFVEHLEKILNIDYPKSKIDLFVRCSTIYHDELVENFILINGDQYRSDTVLLSTDKYNLIENAWSNALQQIHQYRKIDYVFVVDNDVQLNNENILTELIAFNKPFISPKLSEQNILNSNFWIKKSHQSVPNNQYKLDYVNFVSGSVKAIWNVTCAFSCFLIKAEIIKNINFQSFTKSHNEFLCNHLHEKNIQVNIVNYNYYGNLINTGYFDTNLLKPDFYEYESNHKEWKERYIHEDIPKEVINYKFIKPCLNVYTFPVVTEMFCNDVLVLTENLGIWSTTIPKVKIYRNKNENNHKVTFSHLWSIIVKDYIVPIHASIYYARGDGQPSIETYIIKYLHKRIFNSEDFHHSTYILHTELNTPEVDFIGGGYKFSRYDCSVLNIKKGWVLVYPGILTHLNKEFEITNGTRYAIKSFVTN